ncbi:transcription factor [Asimina triloba]
MFGNQIICFSGSNDELAVYESSDLLDDLAILKPSMLRILSYEPPLVYLVGIQLPTVEVRFEHLTIEAKCYVGTRALPTLINTARNIAESALAMLGIRLTKRTTLTILKDASGVIKPSRMTLLLGPPSSGKTTLLLALAGRLDPSLKVQGEVTYNGYRQNEFVPQKTSAYISQNDVHIGEITVKETLDFSARCQGVGSRYELLTELARREKDAGIHPEADVDLFMKSAAHAMCMSQVPKIHARGLGVESLFVVLSDRGCCMHFQATAMEGIESSLQTDYILRVRTIPSMSKTIFRETQALFAMPKANTFTTASGLVFASSAMDAELLNWVILGLDICKDTIVGDEMHRGVSGGQRKRVTTGEMIVGPTKTLFMDEISTGLDSSTTFQIVKCLQQIVHLTGATIFMSLLQPAPETYDLFDDIVLLSEGLIVYQGPKEHVLEFFESCGFRCPERKGTADFLQEMSTPSFTENSNLRMLIKAIEEKLVLVLSLGQVTSKKDQEQYWADKGKPYRYIPVSEFSDRFKRFHAGLNLAKELSAPYDKSKSHKAALVFSKYLVSKKELLKASFSKEWLLIKRNSFVYVFKTVQIIIMAIITSTVFLRTEMDTKSEDGGGIYVGALLFAMIVNMFNGFAELSLTITRLPVFYKQRDLMFHPPWVFTLPYFVLKIPISLLEAIVWLLTTYYTIGFAPHPSRFFKQLLVVFLIQQTASGLFRLIAGVCRTMIIANTGGALMLLIVFMLGGFILPKGEIPKWWIWGYWISPLTYAFNALAINEMLASRWMNQWASDGVTKLGIAVLKNYDAFTKKYSFWIGTAALLGYTILFNVLFTLALMYLNPSGKPQAVISEEAANEMEGKAEESNQERRVKRRGSRGRSNSRSSSASHGNNDSEKTAQNPYYFRNLLFHY